MPVTSYHSILTCDVSRILPVPHNVLNHVVTLELLTRLAMLPKAGFTAQYDRHPISHLSWNEDLQLVEAKFNTTGVPHTIAHSSLLTRVCISLFPLSSLIYRIVDLPKRTLWQGFKIKANLVTILVHQNSEFTTLEKECDNHIIKQSHLDYQATSVVSPPRISSIEIQHPISLSSQVFHMLYKRPIYP